MLTHPVTIGKLISDHTARRKKNSPKTVHLVGTDKPEATMIYAGFYHEILAANPLNPIKLVRFMCPSAAELTFPCFETEDFVIEINNFSDDSDVCNFKTRKSRITLEQGSSLRTF